MTPGRTTSGPTSKSMPTKDSTPTPTSTGIGSFDFGDVDFDEVVPLSIMIPQWCIDACAVWLGATSQSCGSMSSPEVLPPGWRAPGGLRLTEPRGAIGVFRRCARGSHG